MYAGMNPNISERADKIFLFSLASIVPVAIAAVLFCRWLVRPPNKKATSNARWLVVFLFASCLFPIYLVFGGLRQYSPPLAESMFQFRNSIFGLACLLVLLASLLTGRVLWSHHRSIKIHSSQLYHRMKWVFVLLILQILLLIYQIIAPWGPSIDAWLHYLLYDVKMMLLVAVLARAVQLVCTGWRSESGLNELILATDSDATRVAFGVVAGCCLLLIGVPSILWFEFAFWRFWMCW
jgi:hypothetical protein